MLHAFLVLSLFHFYDFPGEKIESKIDVPRFIKTKGKLLKKGFLSLCFSIFSSCSYCVDVLTQKRKIAKI